jgi:hypothetical protein
MNKKTITNLLDPYFFSKGFEFDPFGDGKYILENELGTFEIVLFQNFKRRDFLATTYLVTLNEIESVLDKIRPEKKIFKKRTMQDLINNYEYGKLTRSIDLTKKEGFIQWADLVKHYVENEGAAFIKQYTHLPNILRRMYELKEQGELSYGKILFGQVDHIFRALIVSKLCNDPGYSAKIKRYDDVLLVDRYAKWQPFYIKLKEILKNTEPKYDYIKEFGKENNDYSI